MTDELKEIHLKVGSLMNRDGVCGKKINYRSEESAVRASNSMNKKTEREGYHELEPYPCYYCNGWHIGRKMSIEEMKKYISESEDSKK